MVDYQTADAIAAAPAFLTRVQAALVTLAKAALGGPNDRLAKAILRRRDVDSVVPRMAQELARDGIDFASSDAALDAKLLEADNVALLKASLSVEDA